MVSDKHYHNLVGRVRNNDPEVARREIATYAMYKGLNHTISYLHIALPGSLALRISYVSTLISHARYGWY